MEIRNEMFDLVRAFDEARLVALHIDMQGCFYSAQNRDEHYTAHAFNSVNAFARDLREFAVPNLWIAYVQQWVSWTYADFKQSFSAERGLHDTIHAQDDELVFAKGHKNAFNQSCALTEHLEDNNIKTLIIDGVLYKNCVTETAAGALKKGYRVYIVLDATNCPRQQREEFMTWFNLGNTEKESKLITFTTKEEVINALAARNQYQAQAVPTRGQHI